MIYWKDFLGKYCVIFTFDLLKKHLDFRNTFVFNIYTDEYKFWYLGTCTLCARCACAHILKNIISFYVQMYINSSRYFKKVSFTEQVVCVTIEINRNSLSVCWFSVDCWNNVIIKHGKLQSSILDALSILSYFYI